MKKVNIVLVIMVLVVLASWLIWNRSNSPSQATQSNNSTIQAETEVRLIGTIQAIDNQQPVDGNLRIKISDTWIIIGGGDMPVTNPGIITRFDFNNIEANVGKKAEVYAKRTDYGQNLTILEDSKYYLKITQ